MALQADQARAGRPGERLRHLGLAYARLTLEQQRLLELCREVDGGREGGVREVLLARQCLPDRRRALERAHALPAASCSALLVSTRARCCLYSVVALRSPGGFGALGGLLGRRRDALVAQRLPAQRLLGRGRPQRGGAHVGEAYADVLAGPAVRLHERDHADHRPVLGPAGELLVAPAVPVHGRQVHRGQDLVRPDGRGEEVLEQVGGRDAALAARALDRDLAVHREGEGGEVGCRVPVSHRAADGAAVADLLVGDQRRGVRHDAHLFGVLEHRVRRQRADPPAAVVAVEAAQLADAADVDQQRRRREAQLHQREQRVAARKQLRVLAALAERRDGLVDAAHSLVVELGRDHCAPPSSGLVGPLPAAPSPCSPTSRPCSVARGPPPPSWAASIACRTRIGVNGMSIHSTPSGRRASCTAPATAGVAAIVPGLADALDAERVDRRRRLRAVGLEARKLRGRGQRVVDERARHELPVRVVDDLLVERLADRRA